MAKNQWARCQACGRGMLIVNHGVPGDLPCRCLCGGELKPLDAIAEGKLMVAAYNLGREHAKASVGAYRRKGPGLPPWAQDIVDSFNDGDTDE